MGVGFHLGDDEVDHLGESCLSGGLEDGRLCPAKDIAAGLDDLEERGMVNVAR